MKLVKLNVSGTVFEADTKCLERIKGTLFDIKHSTDSSNEKLSSPSEIYISRPAECFAAIFAFCQTEELHMPTNVCPLAFKRELKYWNIQPTELEKCCQYRYFGFHQEIEVHEEFKKYSSLNKSSHMKELEELPTRCLGDIRYKIWEIMEYSTSSTAAKVYLGLTVFMLLLCIVSQAFSTQPMFRRTLSRCEMIELMEHREDRHASDVKKWLGNPDCSKTFWDYDAYTDFLEDGSTTTESSDNFNTGFISPALGSKETRLPFSRLEEIQKILPNVTRQYVAFDILEYITMSFFTFDICFRLFSCPALRLFFFSILNLIDLITIVAYFAYLATIHTQKEYKYGTGLVNSLEYIQALKIVRMFRIVKELRSSRVLYFSLRQNWKDMLLLLLLFVIAVTMSGSLIYSLEDSETIVSIPTAWYWATITLTTVGYGDISPKTGLGRLLSSCLAVSGVVLLAITLPMFVNNFLTLYTTACIDDYIEDRKVLKQDKHGPLCATTSTKENFETKTGICLDCHTKHVAFHVDVHHVDHTANCQLPKDIKITGEVRDTVSNVIS